MNIWNGENVPFSSVTEVMSAGERKHMIYRRKCTCVCVVHSITQVTPVPIEH